MTQGFQQQDRSDFSVLKSAPSPQHGRKAEPVKLAPPRPPRTFEPRPGR